MVIYFAIYVIGASALLIALHVLNDSYLAESNRLNLEEDVSKEITNKFNEAFFNERGYLAFGNISLKKEAIAEESQIRKLESQYKKIDSFNNDQQFVNSAEEFTNYYFDNKLPLLFSMYESGNHDGLVKLAKAEVTPRINSFQNLMNIHLQKLDQMIEDHFQVLIAMQTNIQVAFVLFMLWILIVLLFIMAYMFRQLGQPLALLSSAANEIANGGDAAIILDTSKEDEIGILSSSFMRMAETVREKEQDLIAQNEELTVQQEKLQEQHAKLEETLAKLQENKEKLKRHNQMINQMSNTLDAQEVLNSIVLNMCKIIHADKGIITMVHDESYSSYGIPQSGVQQFMRHAKKSLYEHLTATKKPFTVRRLQELSEKGYHEERLYCHDLYLPVLSSSEEVIATMMFTRFTTSYLPSQMEEFTALSKNIGISLEKIALFQKSEADRKRNQEILNTLKEGVQLIDRNGTTLQINHYLCELFNCKESTLAGRSWEEWTDFMKSFVKEEQFVENMQKLLAPKRENRKKEEAFIYTIENSNRMIKVYSEEIFHGKTKLGEVLVHQDITKNFEVDRMKSELVSTVSHELRTPLSSILGFTELMLHRDLQPERRKKYLVTILDEANRLTDLINDLLDVQRMESGMQTYEKRQLEILPILNMIIESQQINTKKHEIVLVSEVENPIIFGDKSKISQVFTNLICNAIKYSPDGGTIRVAVSEKEQQLHVSIIDNGLGIPGDALDKLFTKFYRVDNSDRRRIGGTGLGLSISKEIMKAHGGTISVHSEYGKGSTFTVLFPASKDASA